MKSLFVAILVVAFSRVLLAQTPNDEHVRPTLDVHRLVGSIAIDGEVSDAGWQAASHVSEFTSALPIPYQTPGVKTEAFITYDADNLYVAMVAHDPNPSAIHASLVPRDRIWDDDFMGIILDSYGDATRSFEVYVNPRGVEGDLFWSSMNEDMSYDMIYAAESRITDSGWQMEMRIPFSSLRFPDIPTQNFHLTFWRNWPRESDYKFTWAPLSFSIPCTFCQLGMLTGINDIRSSGTLDLLPALVTSQFAHEPHVQESLTNDAVSIKPSITARVSLGTATAIEATIKPDYSQVEADAAQVTANTTFALFYPERRPFFQDGADLWSTALPAVYTRSLGSPIAAAKVLHRDATSSFAFLSSYDETTPIIIPLEERTVIAEDPHHSLSNIIRGTHTFDDDRYVGVLATDRRYFDNGSNTVFGVDGRWRLFENVAMRGQQLFSITRESTSGLASQDASFDGERHTIGMDGEAFTGNANQIVLERYTPGFDFNLEYDQTSPTYRAGDGFVTQNAIHTASAWIGNKWPIENPPAWASWIVELDGSLLAAYNWNYDRESKLELVNPRIDFAFKGQTDLHISYRIWNERFAHVLFDRLRLWQVQGTTRFVKGVVLSWNWRTGEGIYYDPNAPERGKENILTLSGQFKPIEALMIEPSYTYSRLDALNRGGTLFAGSIYWSRITYQFTRQLDLRVITQYDGFAEQVLVDPLLTYRVNPFTSFFVGSAHSFLSDGEIIHARATDRQFFAKLQYLIQT
jgi:hypothetical protein